MKKNEVKQLIKNHKTEIIIIGGILVVGGGILVKSFMKDAAHLATEAEAIKTAFETIPERSSEGYDIWAMIGTKCSPELLDGIKELAESNGKTIFFDHLGEV